MPRSGLETRRRLQHATLELFQQQGYDTTTTAEIAARAGVTERTFFRHFTDKREALFDGEEAFRNVLTETVVSAPDDMGPMAALLHAFRSVEPLLLQNRPFHRAPAEAHRPDPGLAGAGADEDGGAYRCFGGRVVSARCGGKRGFARRADWNGDAQPCHPRVAGRSGVRFEREPHNFLCGAAAARVADRLKCHWSCFRSLWLQARSKTARPLMMTCGPFHSNCLNSPGPISSGPTHGDLRLRFGDFPTSRSLTGGSFLPSG